MFIIRFSFGRQPDDVAAVVNGLKQLGMDLEEEDDIAGFLGVLVKRHTNGTIELIQIGLIQRMLDALQMNHLHAKKSPVIGVVLSSHQKGFMRHFWVCLATFQVNTTSPLPSPSAYAPRQSHD
jgi:hypothetical protein